MIKLPRISLAIQPDRCDAVRTPRSAVGTGGALASWCSSHRVTACSGVNHCWLVPLQGRYCLVWPPLPLVILRCATAGIPSCPASMHGRVVPSGGWIGFRETFPRAWRFQGPLIAFAAAFRLWPFRLVCLALRPALPTGVLPGTGDAQLSVLRPTEGFDSFHSGSLWACRWLCASRCICGSQKRSPKGLQCAFSDAAAGIAATSIGSSFSVIFQVV